MMPLRTFSLVREKVVDERLHHDPTECKPDDQERFNRQYAETLESYREAFDETPPNDIWPPPAERFDTNPKWRRISLAKSFVVPNDPGRAVYALV